MNEIYDLKQENSSAQSLLKHESFNHSINNDCAKEEESTNEELGTIMPASLGNNCTNFEPVSLWNNRSSLTLEQATQWFLGTILPVSFGNNPTNTPLYCVSGVFVENCTSNSFKRGWKRKVAGINQEKGNKNEKEKGNKNEQDGKQQMPRINKIPRKKK